MRNGAVAGIVIVLLCGSAWAKTATDYRPVKEICLFSAFLAPADSPVALQSLDTFRDAANGYDVAHDVEMSLASENSNVFRSGANAVMTAGSPLKGVYELLGGDWRSPGSDLSARILLGIPSDGTSFVLDTGDATNDGKMKLMLSTVPSRGVERNGFVAGFNMKF